MLVVHHLENSRSQRVLWLLEELGIPYEVKRYAREASMRAPAALKAIHPLGKSPIVTDGDLVVAESGAIVEYVLDRYGDGGLRPPPGTPERLRYSYWLHFAEGSAMPPLLLKLVLGRLPTAAPAVLRPLLRVVAGKAIARAVEPQLADQRAFMEAELGRTPWFAGADMTAADIQMSFPVEAFAARGGLDARYPNLTGFLARIHGRDAYKRALERGGPYALLS
ncbi:glutathione S-transferase family protein [Chelatococcus reniformis]|uniref:glutathione transferase n=1 Tax=Chelatococcus reniformis TaxID=1494448 RepID=A0A916U7I3_9HYPH|nr:glutathione S-transferase [Chelatococcus reniformis]GGC63484.1 glutathione S-transferase [Chelatococcus reniformis]